MSLKIDPCEVLSHLNYLGYKNITAPQLQAFIKDLKKLIKYDRSANETNEIRVNILRSLSNNRENRTECIHEDDKRENVSSQSLTESKQKGSEIVMSTRRPFTEPSQVSFSEDKKKDRDLIESTTDSTSTVLCPVHCCKSIGHSGKSRPKSAGTACTCSIDVRTESSGSCNNNNTAKKLKKTPGSAVDNKRGANTTDKHPCIRDKKIHFSKFNPSEKNSRKATVSRNCTHDFTHPCFCSESKPRSSVIKCRMDNKPTFPKCDPVNLHKYYQRQWEINRIPGENMSREQRFRWCLREKITCGPPEYGDLNYLFLQNRKFRSF